MKNLFRPVTFRHFHRGFSLLEILVALGLVAIIGAGLASVIANATKQQKGIQAKDQQREITAELRTLLSDRTACLNSFGGINPSGTGALVASVPAVKDKFGVDRYNKTDPIKSKDKTGLLKFVDFQVGNWTSATGNADFQVRLSKIGDTGTARDIAPDNIKLKVKVDSSGNINECFSIGTVSDSLWQIGTNPSDIGFLAGNVGIGTLAPSTNFHIISSAANGAGINLESNQPGGQLYGIYSTAAAASGGPGNFLIYNPGTAGVGGSVPFLIQPGGNIGIDTQSPTARLDINGSINNSASALAAVDAGTLRINNNNAAAGSVKSKLNLAIGGLGSAVVASNYETYNSTGDIGVGMIFGTQTNAAGGTAERMRISASGNVGIGTTKPLASLNVASASGNGFIAVETDGASGTSQTGLLLVTKSNGTALGAGLGATGWELFGRGANWNAAFDGTQPNAFGLAYNDGAGTSFTHALSILPSGNVGIGTPAPSTNLHITSSAANGAGINLESNQPGGRSYGIYSTAAAASGGPGNLLIYNPNPIGGSTVPFLIQPDGNIGINTLTPGYKLDVNGDINTSGSVRSTGVALTSDIRFKKDIQTLEISLEKILSLRGVEFNWRGSEFPERQFNDRHQIGVIAQEVEKVFPEVVDTNKDGFKSVNYPALVAPLIEAIKMLYNQIAKVEIQLAGQDLRIASKADRAETDALKAENAQLKASNKIKDQSFKDLEQRLERIEKYLNSK